MKKLCCFILAVCFMFSLCACGYNDSLTPVTDGIFKVVMVPDVGGINDQSFNQSAWEGLQHLKETTGAQVSYSEPKQTADFMGILDKLSDGDYNLIWGIGFIHSDAILETSKLNLDKNYAIADFSYGADTPNNVTGVTFRSQEAAFMVGYIAGMTTKTNKVGFVGGMKNLVIDQFEYGFKAGVFWAAKELNKEILVSSQYAESFSDVAKGKAIASRLYGEGCDILFHAAGGVGYGVIECAKDENKLVIGVDRDQSDLAPNNILTSALKKVGNAVEIVSKKLMNGEEIGGTTQEFGLKENCVGIPEQNKILDPNIYNKTIELSKKMLDGKIKLENKDFIVPFDAASYQVFANI